MRGLRLLLWLCASYVLSYGLVIIAHNFQVFSYARFARLALYLTPIILFAILLLNYRFPPPNDWTRTRSFKREAIGVAGFALLVSLALIPVYAGLSRYLATLIIVLSALFIWGMASVLPALSGINKIDTLSQIEQKIYLTSEPYSWNKSYIEISLLVFYFLVGVVGMGIFLYMAQFARMYGDDWCYHMQALTRGFFAASIDFYLSWSGRFFSNFLVFAGAGNRWTPLFQMILVVLSIFACSYLVVSPTAYGGMRVRSGRILRILWSLACAFFIPFIIFSITPDPYKSLYWIVSSVVVLPFIILFPVNLAFANAIITRIRNVGSPSLSQARAAGYAVFAFVLSFILSTIHEVATLPVMIFSGFMFLAALYLRTRRTDDNVRYATIIFGFALSGSLLGLIITYLSPGNAIRHTVQDYPQPPDVLTLLRLNTYYFLRYLSRISLGTIPFSKSGGRELFGVEWFALVVAYTLGYLGARFGQSRWNPLIVLVATLIMTWVSFLPGTYAAQAEIPTRAELIPTTILVIGSFTAGYLSPKVSPAFFPIAILSIVLLLNSFFMWELFNKQLTLINPIVEYAGEWDIRNTRLLTGDEAVSLLHPPWDEIEQGKCIIEYYNFRRMGFYDE